MNRGAGVATLDLERSRLTGADESLWRNLWILAGAGAVFGVAGAEVELLVVVGTMISIELSVWASTKLLLRMLNTPIQLILFASSNWVKCGLRDGRDLAFRLRHRCWDWGKGVWAESVPLVIFSLDFCAFKQLYLNISIKI